MIRSASYAAVALSAALAGSNASEIAEVVSSKAEALKQVTAQSTAISDPSCTNVDNNAATTAKLDCEESSLTSPIDCANEPASSSQQNCNDLQRGSIQPAQKKSNGCP